MSEKRYLVAQLDQLDATPCPCGTTRRAFQIPENRTATVHLVTISETAQVHYHRNMTEIYIILEGTGHLELDGELIPVKPLTTVMIQPGCKHRAIGQLKLLNIPIPAFNPDDEWFD